jgi:hypothetical protein
MVSSKVPSRSHTGAEARNATVRYHQSSRCQAYRRCVLGFHGLGILGDVTTSYERDVPDPAVRVNRPSLAPPSVPGPSSVMTTPLPGSPGTVEHAHPSLDLTLGAIEIGVLLSTL